MGFWGKIEQRFFTGSILKDYGVVYERKPFPWWSVEYRVLLTEKDGLKHVVIKQRSGMRGELNVSYHDFDLKGVKRLKEILDQILSAHT